MGCVRERRPELEASDGNIKVLVEGPVDARAPSNGRKTRASTGVVVKVLAKQREAGSDAESTMSRVVSRSSST